VSSHPIVHVEIPAHDPAAAGRFYADLFGWAIQSMPEFDYHTFAAQPGPGGGFPKVDDQTFKPGDVTVYVGTDDIGATLAKVEALGGKTLLPKTEIPNIGWFAFFSDPTGNRIGLFTGQMA